jgi:hypothetical protein
MNSVPETSVKLNTKTAERLKRKCWEELMMSILFKMLQSVESGQ